MNFTLGTATFGSNYGIANHGKVLQMKDCFEILDAAQSLEIQSLDTAPDYGTSEEIIGKFYHTNPNFKIYTKISGNVEISIQSVKYALSQSKAKLNYQKLEGVYFHSPEKLISSQKKQVKEVIAWIRENGITSKVGISVYEEDQLKRMAEDYPELNLFQVPENILDRRLLDSQVVRELKKEGAEFNIRSIFLQGLLLMKENEAPLKLKKAFPKISQLIEIASSYRITLENLCLSYAQSISWASNLIIGVHSKAQLFKILQHTPVKLDLRELPEPLATEILDPRSWIQS